MIIREFFEFIFYKACKFDEFISKDKYEWTYFYGVIIVTLFITLNIDLLLNILFYFFDPTNLKLIGKYFKFVITLILLLVLIYVRRQNKYVQIMNKCKAFSKKKKYLYGVLSLIYLVFLIVFNLWISEYIREYNITGVHVFEKFHNLKWKY